jgi:hypothetical protein
MICWISSTSSLGVFASSSVGLGVSMSGNHRTKSGIRKDVSYAQRTKDRGRGELLTDRSDRKTIGRLDRAPNGVPVVAEPGRAQEHGFAVPENPNRSRKSTIGMRQERVSRRRYMNGFKPVVIIRMNFRRRPNHEAQKDPDPEPPKNLMKTVSAHQHSRLFASTSNHHNRFASNDA